MEEEISVYTPNGGGQDKLPYNKTYHVLGPHHPNSGAQNNPLESVILNGQQCPHEMQLVNRTYYG